MNRKKGKGLLFTYWKTKRLPAHTELLVKISTLVLLENYILKTKKNQN